MMLRLGAVHDRIDRAAEFMNRDPAGITLIAVSKTRSIPELQAAYDLGQRHFGESKVQEAIPKVEALPKDITWHFIGHLQSNKAKKCAEYFSVIHSLSSEGQLKEIEKGSKTVDGLIEINIAEESQKSGILPSDLDQFALSALQYKRTRIRGLMTIGPQVDNPEDMRPWFRTLANLSARIGSGWKSMGMSSDFEVAIQEGASHIRVGTALFGERI
ncbi:COG0325 Predicted enzyme with a TIM-barrel fold [Fimbriimonadaceae bacterium]